MTGKPHPKVVTGLKFTALALLFGGIYQAAYSQGSYEQDMLQSAQSRNAARGGSIESGGAPTVQTQSVPESKPAESGSNATQSTAVSLAPSAAPVTSDGSGGAATADAGSSSAPTQFMPMDDNSGSAAASGGGAAAATAPAATPGYVPPAVTPASGSRTAVSSKSMLDTLFKQAHLWHDKYQPKPAIQTLNRILLADPDNTEALYLLSKWSSESGDTQSAAVYRDRLSTVAPDDPRLKELESQKELDKYSKDQLQRARSLASAGNIPAALNAYQRMFNGSTPPPGLVSEYYLTMSGDPGMYNDAVRGIKQYIRANPSDTGAKVTFGKLLSYRDNTRRSAIELLEFYAPNSADADEALKQALLWYTPAPEDEKFYRNYAKRHPDDAEVLARFQRNVADNLTAQAYEGLNSQDLSKARESFEEILKRDPNNADALEGLGYLYLRQKDYARAAEYLNKAAAQPGSKQDKLRYDAVMARANLAISQGDPTLALAMADDLLKSPGSNHEDAHFLKAQIYRQLKQYDNATEELKSILRDNPSSRGAGEMLYYTYREAGKADQAKALLDTLPADLRQTLIARSAPKPDPVSPIRKEAERYLSEGDLTSAIATLQNGVATYPQNAWLRYDLARALDRAGRPAQAQSQLFYLTRDGASNEQLFAAANYLNAAGDFVSARAVAERISPSFQNGAVRDLKSAIAFKENVSRAEHYLKAGQKSAALNTLRSTGKLPRGLSAAELGHLAALYQQAGDSTTALRLADQARAAGMGSQAGLGDYAEIIDVYNKTSHYDKAQALLTDPRVQANTTPAQLSAMSSGNAVRQADLLRENGRSADAYDVLYEALKDDPQNPSLMMAMARLYHDNQKYPEARAIYARVLGADPVNQEAVVGAINSALSDNDGEAAQALESRLSDPDNPHILILKARIARQNKDYAQAIEYLKRSKSTLEGSPYITRDPRLTQAAVPVHAYNNPFRNAHSVVRKPDYSQQLGLMPWETGADPNNGSVFSATPFAYDMDALERSKTLRDVNTMLRELYDKTATYMSAYVHARQKDGEDGLSTVNGFAVPITFSTPLFEDHRFSVTFTPTSMDAGSASADSNYKSGSVGLSVGVNNIIIGLNSLITAVQSTTDADAITALDNQLSSMGLSDAQIAALHNAEDTLSPGDYNIGTAEGLEKLNRDLSAFAGSNTAEITALRRAINSYYSGTGTYASHARRSNGANFALKLQGDLYSADIGVNSIGKRGSTFVGGIDFHPKLTQDLTLRVKLERRSLNDSVLSYYGMKDDYSGATWGSVTKNGGSLQLAYDNGYFGAYAGPSFYAYSGDHVKTNHSKGFSAGVYVRPLNTDEQTLTVGVSAEYQDFDNNQNHFTYGYGGYFSPSDYYTISIPVNYKRKVNDNLDFALSASIGYQSYTNEAAPYYPTRSDWQGTLETLASYGFVKEAWFEKENESGVGGSVSLDLHYHINDVFTVSGHLDYNTFGEYKEYNEMLTFKYLLGGY